MDIGQDSFDYPHMTVIPPKSLGPEQRDESLEFPYWRRNLKVLPLANMLTSMGFAMSFPFLPVMVRSLGVQDHLETWVGNMMLVFYVISFLCGPVWGGIADHYGRKVMVLRAMLGMGFFMMLVPFAPSALWFACLFALVGFFNGATMSSQTLLVANTPPARLGGALSYLQTGSLVGQTMGPALATVLAALVDKPHWMFWASGTLLLIGGMLVIFFVREVKQLAAGPWRPQWIGNLRELLAIPRIGLLYLLCFVFAGLAAGSQTIVSVYIIRLLAAQPAGAGSEAFWVGAAAMGFAISSVISLTLWGRVLDRYDPARVLVVATCAAALTQLPLLFLQTPLQLVLTRVAFGLSASLMLPAIIRLLKNFAPAGMDARAISYATSFQFMAMGLAPFSAGLIGPVFGLRAYFALTAGLTFLALALWLRYGRRADS